MSFEADLYSPSSNKPRLFVDYLTKHRYKLDIASDFSPVSTTDLERAHDKKFIEAILNLKIKNGFGLKSKEMLQSILYCSGSLYAAAVFALENKRNTCSPTSGFHHACYSSCGLFCTFNGLMITALKLLDNGLAQNVGILDLDMHFGDGTEDIIKAIGETRISHYSFGALGVNKKSSEKWLLSLESGIKYLDNSDIILYQAGADPHVDDPLGGVLTTDQMKRRDEIVCSFFRSLDIPIAWNLAGGYQDPIRKVLKLHKNTYEVFDSAQAYNLK